MEPGQLIEKIEKHLASGKCPSQDRKKLEELAATLDENDNNVLFVGKVKESKIEQKNFIPCNPPDNLSPAATKMFHEIVFNYPLKA